jgi:hypothetical protein
VRKWLLGAMVVVQSDRGVSQRDRPCACAGNATAGWGSPKATFGAGSPGEASDTFSKNSMLTQDVWYRRGRTGDLVTVNLYTRWLPVSHGWTSLQRVQEDTPS